MTRKATPDLMGGIDIMDDILSAGTAKPREVSWDGRPLNYPIDRVQVGKRLRPLGDVTTLAESMRQIGQLNPINILPDGTLVAGYHRLEAAKRLGWATIRAIVVEMDEVDAELAEIDENLRRNNLTVLEESEHLMRRMELLEAKGIRAKAGDNQHGGGETVALPTTTADIATEIGISERSTQMRLQIARNLDGEVRDQLRATEVANSTTQLVELSRQPAEKQRTIADMLISGQAANVNEAVRLISPPPAPAKKEYWTPMPVSEELPTWAKDSEQNGAEPTPPKAPMARTPRSGIHAYTWEDYKDWDASDEEEYVAIRATWQLPAREFNSLSQLDKIVHWRVAARLAAEREDNIAFSLDDRARVLRRQQNLQRQQDTQVTEDPSKVKYAPLWKISEVLWNAAMARGWKAARVWDAVYRRDIAMLEEIQISVKEDLVSCYHDSPQRLVKDSEFSIALEHLAKELESAEVWWAAADAREAAQAAVAVNVVEDILNPVPVSLKPDYDSDEWYTPAEYIEAARKVMGSIDLDPASCDLAQTVVQADVYLTKAENGLKMQWIRDNVWLNCPYSDPAPWIEKVIAHNRPGRQAVILVNNATETEWFQSLLKFYPVCFPERRIAFWRHDQKGITARQGQAIFYLGPNVADFVREFRAFGPIMQRKD